MTSDLNFPDGRWRRRHEMLPSFCRLSLLGFFLAAVKVVIRMENFNFDKWLPFVQSNMAICSDSWKTRSVLRLQLFYFIAGNNIHGEINLRDWRSAVELIALIELHRSS